MLRPPPVSTLPDNLLPCPTPFRPGGWAGLDKDVGEALKMHGIPVVGIDSLRYFWGKRTPDGLAQDVDRIIRYYAQRWHRHHVLLIGYSQGANVLPFAYNRLPAATREMIAVTAMMGDRKSTRLNSSH